MKRTFLMICLIVCAICVWADQYDQQYFSDASLVELEKAGTLSKALGKNTESITSLQIKGDMSDKDMKSLAKLTNLKKLSLRYANIENTKYFPTFQDLEVLFLPENQHLPAEYMTMVPANENLRVMMFCSFLDRQADVNNSNNNVGLAGLFSSGKESHPAGTYVRFSPFKSLQKVIITNMLHGKVMDYKNYGVATGDMIASGENDFIKVDTIVYLCNREEFAERNSKITGKHTTKDVKQQFRGNYEVENDIVYFVGNENVDFTTVQAVRKPEVLSWWENNPYGGKTNKEHIMRPAVPAILNLKMMQYIAAGYFNDTEVKEINFSSTSLVLEKQAFRGAEQLKTITFSSSLSSLYIPQECFSNCTNLESIIFDCPVTIEQFAFSFDNNIKEIIFNKEVTIHSKAFLVETSYDNKPSISKVTFNAPVNIESEGLMYVDTIVFNDVPTSLTSDFSLCQNIIIPLNTSDRFTSWGIKGDYLIDPSASLTLDIVVAEPGNILKYLPLDSLTQVKSLTVTGPLYETDIAILKQCTNLQYLNLADTYITESPTSQERRQEENQMWADIVELSAIDAEMKYKTGQSSKRETRQQVAAAIHTAAMMQQDNMPECYIPAGAFENMRLVEVVLPKTVKEIYREAFRDCKSLTKVDLGEALVTIGVSAFENTQLREITIPTTLKKIYDDAFRNVRSLKILDLSHCAIDEYSTFSGLNTTIGYMPDLEVFYMPNKISSCAAFSFGCPKLIDFYVGKDVKSIDREISNINLHFQSELAPEIGMFSKVSNCTIYVPKNGNLTSYYARFNGNGNKIVQE